MATLFQDDFNRADSTDLGPDWTEAGPGDDWSIVGNTVRNTFDNNILAWARTAAIGTADYTVQADVNPSASGNYGVCARRINNGASDTDLYGAFIHDGNNQFTVYKRVSASWTLLGFYNTPLANGTFYTVKLSANGTTIKGFLDGTERISATDSALSAAGDAGMVRSSFGQTAIWDNFLVEDFAAGGQVHPASGTAAGSSSGVGAAAKRNGGAGAALGTSSALGHGGPIRAAGGMAISTSSVVGLPALVQFIAGTAIGLSSALGQAFLTKPLAGSTLGQSSAVGAVTKIGALGGVAGGESLAVGTAAYVLSTFGLAPGTSSVSGTAEIISGSVHQASGFAAGISSTLGTATLALGGRAAVLGASTGIGTVALVLAGAGRCSGTSAGMGTGLIVSPGAAPSFMPRTSAIITNRNTRVKLAGSHTRVRLGE